MAVDILSKLNTNGSGLNLRDLTKSLVAAEITPLQQAQTEKAGAAQVSISRWDRCAAVSPPCLRR